QSNCECASGNCYNVPFLGGQCVECDNVEGDLDCVDITGGGCSSPNPYENNGSTCNMGEIGGGCQSSDVCQDGLVCSNVFDLLGIIQINTCGVCDTDADCTAPDICAPVVDLSAFSGSKDCILPGSLPQDSYCNLDGNGNEACEDVCSVVDVQGIAEVGACGQCLSDADCNGGSCVF